MHTMLSTVARKVQVLGNGQRGHSRPGAPPPQLTHLKAGRQRALDQQGEHPGCGSGLGLGRGGECWSAVTRTPEHLEPGAP